VVRGWAGDTGAGESGGFIGWDGNGYGAAEDDYRLTG